MATSKRPRVGLYMRARKSAETKRLAFCGVAFLVRVQDSGSRFCGVAFRVRVEGSGFGI